jgi:glycosyltransferase involved in cell wall biosynthesis
MKVLMICTTCPAPPSSGASIRSSGWLRTIAEFAEVGLVTLTRNERERAALAELESACATVRSFTAPRTPIRKIRDVVLAAINATPYLVQSGRERRMQAAVDDILDRWRPDVVQAELLPAAPYLVRPRGFKIPTVYSAHNVESRIVRGPENGLAGRLRAGRMGRVEARIARRADAVVTVSGHEAKLFRALGAQVCRVPNAIDPGSYRFRLPSERVGQVLLFVGHLGYRPNVDAAVTLVRAVLPEVRRELPQVECVIAGAEPMRVVRALAGGGVHVVANPLDIDDLWSRATARVCPLRWGAGSRIKILEAAASGVPVVATRFSVEGLELEEGTDFLAGEEPSELAASVISLMREVAAADSLALRARKGVERNHSWAVMQPRMTELYESLVDHRRKR